jgi:hypothetical protein
MISDNELERICKELVVDSIQKYLSIYLGNHKRLKKKAVGV